MKSQQQDRKEKKWFQPAFDFGCSDIRNVDNRNETKSANPTVNQTSLSSSVCTQEQFDVQYVQSDNWINKFSPKEVCELAVNGKKVQEVQEWLSKAFQGGPGRGPMLLLTGPSGCGKTTTVHLLAHKLGSQISEWITPIDVEYTRDVGPNSYTFQEKQSDKFVDFLLKASRYQSLLAKNDCSRTLLVEDFPNSFIKDPSEFCQILQKYKDRGKSPLIFVCTDTRDGRLNLLWNLFPQNVQDQFGIDHISFNAVASTAMKAALKQVTTLMGNKHSSLYKIPDHECIESIINSSMGDVRSAVNNLHFASLKGSCAIQIKQKRSKESNLKQGKKKKKKEESKLNSIGKDETISIMHGVGRVLNPKYEEHIDGESHQSFTHSPQSIVDLFQMQPVSFVGYIHENYLPHFSNINSVERASDALSDADCFLSEWKERDGKLYALSVAVAGLMVSNKAPVSSWHPIKAPKNTKITYPRLQDMSIIEENQLIQGKILATDFKTFCQIISESIKPNISFD